MRDLVTAAKVVLFPPALTHNDTMEALKGVTGRGTGQYGSRLKHWLESNPDAFSEPISAEYTDNVSIRTYTAAEGKLDALHARFRDHTLVLFEKHGMTNVGYFKPQDEPLKQNTLIYILAHPSREAAAKNWQAFQSDPEWRKAKAASETQGALTTKIESVFVDPTDYSPMK